MADDFCTFFNFDAFDFMPAMENYEGSASAMDDDQWGFPSGARLQEGAVFEQSTVLSDEALNQMLDESLDQYDITSQQVSSELGTACNEMDSNSFLAANYFHSNDFEDPSWLINGEAAGQTTSIEELESFDFDALINQDFQSPDINHNEQIDQQAPNMTRNLGTPSPIYATLTHPQPMHILNSGFTHAPIANQNARLQYFGQYPPAAEVDLNCLQSQGLLFNKQPQTYSIPTAKGGRSNAPPVVPEEDLQMIRAQGEKQAATCLARTFTVSSAPPIVPGKDITMTDGRSTTPLGSPPRPIPKSVVETRRDVPGIKSASSYPSTLLAVKTSTKVPGIRLGYPEAIVGQSITQDSRMHYLIEFSEQDKWGKRLQEWRTEAPWELLAAWTKEFPDKARWRAPRNWDAGGLGS